MDIVKKNLVSIICGVVALIALVAAFVWPLDGWIEEVKEEATKRAALQGKIDNLVKKSRFVPNFDPNRSETVRLTQFPGTMIIKQATDALRLVQDDGDAAYKAAEKANKANHELVVPGSLPKEINQQIPIEFRSRLEEALDHLRLEVLESGIPPTDEELKKRADARRKELNKEIIVVDNKPINLPEITKKLEDDVRAMPEQMQKEMATQKKMYVDPSAVLRVPDKVPADGKSADTWSMWWAQVNFWVTKDVVTAIQEVNAGSHNVLESPIKNLLRLSVPDTFFPGPGPADATSSAAAAATGGVPDAKLAIPENAAFTPTKRVSNNLYDVVHFQMAIDIEADKIPLFLKTLPTDRMITVIRFETFPVDPQLKQINGYVYGPKPVMTLVLDCEALFLRSWTQYYMPKALREQLAIPDPVAPPKEKGKGKGKDKDKDKD